MKRLRIVLGLQLLFFAGWAGYLMVSRSASTPEFYLETTPVDPRDLISGTYVALNYEISDPRAGSCAELSRSELAFYVKLDDRGKTAVTAQGQVPVYQVTDCSREASYAPGWARADVEIGRGVKYGIERFYLNEGDPRKDARSGSVLAKVKIGSDRKLFLLDLVKKI
ncbi:MAG TPA: GDYXXLXY domain-containing protein [Elusimicrobiales bacterium]|nr:GDYXXLXY domain-containing protein [Elusimicrobiales bacterium]